MSETPPHIQDIIKKSKETSATKDTYLLNFIRDAKKHIDVSAEDVLDFAKSYYNTDLKAKNSNIPEDLKPAIDLLKEIYEDKLDEAHMDAAITKQEVLDALDDMLETGGHIIKNIEQFNEAYNTMLKDKGDTLTPEDIISFAREQGVVLNEDGDYISGEIKRDQNKSLLSFLQSEIAILQQKKLLAGMYDPETEKFDVDARSKLSRDIDYLIDQVKARGIKIERQLGSPGYNIPNGFLGRNARKARDPKVGNILNHIKQKYKELTNLNDASLQKTKLGILPDNLINDPQKAGDYIKSEISANTYQRKNNPLKRMFRRAAMAFGFAGALGGATGAISKTMDNYNQASIEANNNQAIKNADKMPEIKPGIVDIKYKPEDAIKTYEMLAKEISLEYPVFKIGEKAPTFEKQNSDPKKTYTIPNEKENLGDSITRTDLIHTIKGSTVGAVVVEKTYTQSNKQGIGKIFMLKDSSENVLGISYAEYDKESNTYTITATTKVNKDGTLALEGKVPNELKKHIATFGGLNEQQRKEEEKLTAADKQIMQLIDKL